VKIRVYLISTAYPQQKACPRETCPRPTKAGMRGRNRFMSMAARKMKFCKANFHHEPATRCEAFYVAPRKIRFAHCGAGTCSPKVTLRAAYYNKTKILFQEKFTDEGPNLFLVIFS